MYNTFWPWVNMYFSPKVGLKIYILEDTVLDQLTSEGAVAPILKYFFTNCGHIFKDLSQARALYTLGQIKVCRKSGYLGPTYGNRAFVLTSPLDV